MQRPRTSPKPNVTVSLGFYYRSTCPIWLIFRPTNQKPRVCKVRTPPGMSIFHIDRPRKSIRLPAVATIVDGIHFINVSFEHFFCGQLTFRRVSHFVRYFFDGFVLFAFLVLLCTDILTLQMCRSFLLERIFQNSRYLLETKSILTFMVFFFLSISRWQ